MVTDSKTKSLFCLKAALEKKALDPVLLELKGVASFTDYFLICSGKSDRQVQAIAQAIEEALKRKGVHPLGLEGTLGGKWILMDYEDVVIHIFLEPVRRFYDLEGLWIDAPKVDLGKGVMIEETATRTKKRVRQKDDSTI
ncbi:MAG: ribosome silencing factor [Thermodesulfobacteriota bacterium]